MTSRCRLASRPNPPSVPIWRARPDGIRGSAISCCRMARRCAPAAGGSVWVRPSRVMVKASPRVLVRRSMAAWAASARACRYSTLLAASRAVNRRASSVR